MRTKEIHSFYEDEDANLVEIELQYCIGTNEKVKILNQKGVNCFENLSFYAFRSCRRMYMRKMLD